MKLERLFGTLYDNPVKKRDWNELRGEMVERQIASRGIQDPHVLDAMQSIPRHRFVPEAIRSRSYEDRALGIGYGQTISQPYMVAVMLQALGLTGQEKVLEVGTGSGYQAAVLSRLAREVISVDIVPELQVEARSLLTELSIHNVKTLPRDGSEGVPEEAPFDAVIVAAAAPEVPSPLLEQLASGGRLVIPLGQRKMQMLTLIRKTKTSFERTDLGACTFVPLLGRYGWPMSR
jgi:protein-L-isoaspartate(D-aspartate) O-methyltransferase